MATSIALAHTKKDKTFSVVMCPSHLVKKWKSEIERFPFVEAEIVSNLEEFIALEPRINDMSYKTHLFVIMSKEIAKSDYEERPSALWSSSRRCFVCPTCGKPIETRNNFGKNDHRIADMPELAFVKKNRYNYIHAKNSEEGGECETSLWTTMNKNQTMGWVKTGSGWMLEQHLQPAYDKLFSSVTILTKAETKVMHDIFSAMEQLREKKFIVRAPRSYPVARYIRNHYKNRLDYVFLDESHMYKAKESAQGYAAADLINAAKHSLLLTGTLLNGYASGIYHLFFRCFPRTMLKEGFDYEGVHQFQDKFGVIQATNKFENAAGYNGDQIGHTSKKELPGISPIVFTKFMLENSLFIGMDDISEGLPDYKEIPVPVVMDEDLRREYDNFADKLRQNTAGNLSGASGSAKRVAIQFIQGLLIYSDQPFDQPPITDYETDEILYKPKDLDRDKTYAKEKALLNLALEKKYLGEKVMVYYTWTGRTQLDQKFLQIFEDNDLKYVVLDEKVAPKDRQEWIEQQVQEGADGIICNPKKVETGLDLLDFTTIVFYQTGNDPYTLRQASRRSWRLSQTKDVEVYFMYYENTVQEALLNRMATKIQASMAIEGKFSEEGLNAMSQNEDFLTQIANSVVQGISETIDAQVFQKITKKKKDAIQVDRPVSIYRKPTYPKGYKGTEVTSVNSSARTKLRLASSNNNNTLSVFNVMF